MLDHKLSVALCLTALPDSCCLSGCASGGFSVPKQRQSHQEEPRGQEMLTQRNLSLMDMPQADNSCLNHTCSWVSLLTHEGTCQVNGQARFHLSLHMCRAWCQLQTRETLG